MDQKYERTIGLKTIYTTLVRRFHIIVIIFLPVVLVAFIVTNFMMTKTYISTTTINKGGVISGAQYSVIQSYIKDTSSDEAKPGAIYTTAKNLKDNGVKHSNGNEITVNEIESGLSISAFESNLINMTISYQNIDNTVTQTILKELLEISIKYLKERGGGDYNSLTISSPASPATKNSKERTYFLVALAAGFVVAFGIPFVDEIVSDEVYDKYDIESLDCSAFEVKAKSKKKEA